MLMLVQVISICTVAPGEQQQWYHLDVLVQDCSISSALAMEMLQSCTKASIYRT